MVPDIVLAAVLLAAPLSIEPTRSTFVTKGDAHAYIAVTCNISNHIPVWFTFGKVSGAGYDISLDSPSTSFLLNSRWLIHESEQFRLSALVSSRPGVRCDWNLGAGFGAGFTWWLPPRVYITRQVTETVRIEVDLLGGDLCIKARMLSILEFQKQSR
jgi:hypothetical protein